VEQPPIFGTPEGPQVPAQAAGRRVAAVTEAGPVCQSCRPGPDLPCSICGSAGGGRRIGISRATGAPLADARRLLQEEAYPAAYRVAGLLILLYAQKLNVITALTTRHVLHENGRTLLRLGSHPIVMPTPLTPSSPGSRPGAGHRAAACSTFLPRGCSRDAGREER
jgi:hypothetical protein